jgi:hypothetical protein
MTGGSTLFEQGECAGLVSRSMKFTVQRDRLWLKGKRVACYFFSSKCNKEVGDDLQ